MLRFHDHLTSTEASAQAWEDAHQPLLPFRLARCPLPLLLQASIYLHIHLADASSMPASSVLVTRSCTAVMQGAVLIFGHHAESFSTAMKSAIPTKDA